MTWFDRHRIPDNVLSNFPLVIVEILIAAQTKPVRFRDSSILVILVRTIDPLVNIR